MEKAKTEILRKNLPNASFLETDIKPGNWKINFCHMAIIRFLSHKIEDIFYFHS